MTRAAALRRAAPWTALSIASVVLFAVSRGKWSDALIDSGREWIVPDALARGELLYRDVVYWFGPFTPYFHSLFFRALGSSFRSLVVAGIVGAAGVLGCLHFALRQVTGRREAWGWTILAVPLLVFMPNAGGAILGMGYRMWHAAGFSLLALALASRPRISPERGLFLAAGSLAGAAGLCRTEWGVAAAAALVLVVTRRFRGTRDLRPALGWIAAGFLAVEITGLGILAILAGPARVLRDAPVLLFNLPPETLRRPGGLGAAGWLRGSAQMLYGTLALLGAFLALELLAASRRDPARVPSALRRLGLVLLLLGVCFGVGGLPSSAIFSGAPLLCALSVWAGLRTPHQPLGAALAGFGAMGFLASHRRFFFLTDGPYVAPPLLFALVCAAGCVALAARSRPAPVREGLSPLLLAALSVFGAAIFIGRCFAYSADDRVPVPGTEGMLSASPQVVRRIVEVTARLRSETPPGAGVVVFPEGEILNYLSGRSNPIRHKLYLPGYVNSFNEAAIVEELSRASPGALVIWPRPVGEYGNGFFGRDYARSLQSWIDANYRPEPNIGRHGPQLLWRARRD